MKIKDLFKEKYDAYVIFSTLNQVVNYLPYRIAEKQEKKIENVYNITYDSSCEKKDTPKSSENSFPENDSTFKRFDNKRWDELLKDKIEIEKNICIEKNYDQQRIFNKLEENFFDKDSCSERKYKEKKKFQSILWNITGGQRTLIFSIIEFIKQNNRTCDRIIYLEGNTSKLVVGYLQSDSENNKKIVYEAVEDKYMLDELKISEVFELAGFKIQRDYINYLKKELDSEDILELILKEYTKADKEGKEHNKLRWNLVNSNKKKYKDDKVQNRVEIFKDALIDLFEEKYKGKGNTNKFIRKFTKNTLPFGYLLEELTTYVLKKAVESINKGNNEEFFAELAHNLKLYRYQSDYDKKSLRELGEFDVVLLTKNGQVIIFECKSGIMKSDNAKARHYTAYATGGVYGKPILITPLLSDEVTKVYNFIKDNEDKDVSEKTLKDGIYDAIIEALKAAARANIEVWSIDEIEEKLKDLYKWLNK